VCQDAGLGAERSVIRLSGNQGGGHHGKCSGNIACSCMARNAWSKAGCLLRSSPRPCIKGARGVAHGPRPARAAHLHPALPFLCLRPVEQQRRANGAQAGGHGNNCQHHKHKQEDVPVVVLRGSGARWVRRAAAVRVSGQGGSGTLARQARSPDCG
jgi:hypothetical protein